MCSAPGLTFGRPDPARQADRSDRLHDRRRHLRGVAGGAPGEQHRARRAGAARRHLCAQQPFLPRRGPHGHAGGARAAGAGHPQLSGAARDAWWRESELLWQREQRGVYRA